MADAAAAAGLEVGHRFRASGWVVHDEAWAQAYLTPFRPSRVFVWDERLLPLQFQGSANTEFPPLGMRVEVDGVWGGKAFLVSRCAADDVVDPVESAYRELARRVADAYSGGDPENAEFEAFVATLADCPSVLAATYVSTTEHGRVCALTSREPARVEALLARGPAGPSVVLQSRWDATQLDEARALVESLQPEQVLTVGEGTTGRGEPYVHALTTQLPSGFVSERDRLPAGIVDVQVWIQRAS